MSKIKIIPLGGVREDGKSLFVVEVEESIFVLDCGLLYPEEGLLGIDAVIPDFTYLKENAHRVVGVFLTHGHDDAIGALAYLLEEVEVPVFGTRLTLEFAKLIAKEQGKTDVKPDFIEVDHQTEIEFDDATVSFFKTTHTIPDSVGIAIHTPDGAIVYTGDFKFSPNASPLYQTDFDRLTQLGSQGVLALLSDSASAESTSENISGIKVFESITETFMNAQGRVIVSSVGSNIERIQQVLNAANISKRKVFFANGYVYEMVDIAIKLGKITLPRKDLIVDIQHLDKTPSKEVVIIQTGNVGEPLSQLQRMALNRHRRVSIKEGDLVYIVTTPTTAMETVVAKTKNMIYRAGGLVKELANDLKTSGHGTPNQLQLMLNFMRPKYFIPVNGEFRAQRAHGALAKQLGYKDNEIFVLDIGDVVEFNNGKATLTGQVEAGNVLVDGSGVGDIGNVVLRDRRILSEDGIFVVVATISRRLGKVLVGPQITSRGFVFMKASTDLIKACSDMTLDVLEDHLDRKDFEWGLLKSDLREQLGKYLFKETKRRPVVLPIIMEASNYQPSKKEAPNRQNK